MGTVSLPSTSTTSTNRERKHTAARARASPARRAYRFRKRIRKGGTPFRSASATVQPARWASSSRPFRSCQATVSRRTWSSGHSTAQKATAFWAHRFKKRSGKAPDTSSRTLPRSRFTIFRAAMPPPYSSSTARSVPVIKSSLAFMAFSSRPTPRTLTISLPPLTKISSGP